MTKTAFQNRDISGVIRQEVVRVLREMLSDPDFGLELTDYAKKRIKQSLSSKKTVSLDEILKKYKIWLWLDGVLG